MGRTSGFGDGGGGLQSGPRVASGPLSDAETDAVPYRRHLDRIIEEEAEAETVGLPRPRTLAVPDPQPGDSVLRALRERTSWTGDGSDPVSWEAAKAGLTDEGLDVDVYFAAGPRDGTGPPFGASSLFMSLDTKPVASLYKVSIRAPLRRLAMGLGRVTVTQLYGLAADTDVDRFQPAVSPDGTRIAYVERPTMESSLPWGLEGRGHRLWVRDLKSGAATLVSSWHRDLGEKKVLGGIQFPAWYNDQILMWPVRTGEVESAVNNPGEEFNRIDVALVGSGSPPRVGNVISMVGPGTPATRRRSVSLWTSVEDDGDASFEDPERAPEGTAAREGKRSTVFQSNIAYDDPSGDTTVSQAVPIVGDLFGGRKRMSYEALELGRWEDVGHSPYAVTTAQHPFWLDTGELVAHMGPPVFWDTERSCTARWELVYEYYEIRNCWAPPDASFPIAGGDAVAPAYPVPSPADFWLFFGLATSKAASGTASKSQVGAKYGKNVPGGAHIVTTMFYMEPKGYSLESTHGWWRVVLVRRSDGKIWDLTSLVEDFEGVTRGSFGSFAAHAVAAHD